MASQPPGADCPPSCISSSGGLAAACERSCHLWLALGGGPELRDWYLARDTPERAGARVAQESAARAGPRTAGDSAVREPQGRALRLRPEAPLIPLRRSRDRGGLDRGASGTRGASLGVTRESSAKGRAAEAGAGPLSRRGNAVIETAIV